MVRVFWFFLWCAAVWRRQSRFYKDQCICSRSTASSKFVSVSRRLMITAMAASSLLRLLRPGPTILSRSSWEFSPGRTRKGRKIARKYDGRHRGQTFTQMKRVEEKKCKYPLVFPLPGKQLPVARPLSWTFLAAPGRNLLHLAPGGTKVEKHVTVAATLLLGQTGVGGPLRRIRRLTLLLIWLWDFSCVRLNGLTLPLDGDEFILRAGQTVKVGSHHNERRAQQFMLNSWLTGLTHLLLEAFNQNIQLN